MSLVGQASGQAQVRVLVNTDWNHYRPQTTKLLQLRMNDVSSLNQWCLHMGEVGVAFESVNSLELGEVRSPAEGESKSLNGRPAALEVDVGRRWIKS